MDGGVSSASIEVLIRNLINAIKEDHSLIRGLDEEAQQLQTTLSTIRGYLNDAEYMSIDEEAVKIWLRKLEEVAFDADNVLDELRYNFLHRKVNKMKTSKYKVVSCFSSLNRIARPRKMAHRIKQINEDFESMSKSATQLSLQNEPPAAAAAAAPCASFETSSYTHDPIFIGRDDDVLKLVDKLTHIPEEPMLSILAIVGIDGIGKTTLTRKVVNDENVKDQFRSHIWVNASPIFDPIMLFKKILSMLTSETTDGIEDRAVILKKLQEALKAHTYLLVLDDVWNDDLPKWEDFMNSMLGVTSTKGNAIIITTRTVEIASIVRPLHFHFLRDLSDEECWSIIKAKAFGNGDLPEGFESIGKKVAKICWGLPLTANLVGGLLHGQDWPSIEQKWFPDVEGYLISDFLRLVFDSLPSLKKCFAYCSIFPEGCRIVKQELIELWMAEGFLQSNGRDNMESVGNNIFNVLVHNSLLLVAERDDYGNVISCVMLDFVRGFASSILGYSDGTKQVRYLIHDDDSSPIPEETAYCLRTLIFRGDVTDTMFLSFNSLHVLVLECDQVRELPCSIRKLRHLRNLNISRTRIEYLPDWICEFHFLQTLYVFTESLRELPSTFKYLVSLWHIYIPSRVKLPPQIGTFTNLQELKFRVGDQKGYKIEELGSLNNLKQLHIYNLEKVCDKEEAKEANISQKPDLSQLHLEWDEFGEGKRNDESVLEGLQPHANANLKILRIRGFKGKTFPSWMLQLEGLMNIMLSGCQFEEIPRLGQLPNLKSLCLWRLSNVRLINSSFYRMDGYRGDIFPALESMLLSDMAELREWPHIKFGHEVKVFPRLQSLKIYHCKNLECLPIWLFDKAHNLKELDIKHCSKLRELPDALQAFNSLEQMTIKGCQNLKSIVYPSGGGSLTCLRSLEICDCQELKVMVGSQAPLLKKVTLMDLKSLENLASFLDCLAQSPLLEELTIVGIPKFISSSGVEIWPFRKLTKLEIDVSREWSSETCVALKGTVNDILRNCCSSLGELVLMGTQIWECVPESIQNLTALDSLELENFEIEELPEWFENLWFLKRLCLSNCTKLRSLPSRDAMQRLTKLKELRIRDCPEFRIESERHKIFHGTSIYFNGHLV